MPVGAGLPARGIFQCGLPVGGRCLTAGSAAGVHRGARHGTLGRPKLPLSLSSTSPSAAHRRAARSRGSYAGAARPVAYHAPDPLRRARARHSSLGRCSGAPQLRAEGDSCRPATAPRRRRSQTAAPPLYRINQFTATMAPLRRGAAPRARCDPLRALSRARPLESARAPLTPGACGGGMRLCVGANAHGVAFVVEVLRCGGLRPTRARARRGGEHVRSTRAS